MADEMQEMLNAALTNDFERAKHLLAGGLGINETIVLTDKSAGPNAQLEVTVLHIAVMMSRTEVVRFLIANGADVDAKDGRGRTPLELAKDHEIQQLLTAAKDNQFGKKTPAVPQRPAFMSGLISIADIERNDQEMGEMYLHCPNCGEDERINDMGKLMLKQGNNVFANYTCKKCGTVFDGAQATIKVAATAQPEQPAQPQLLHKVTEVFPITGRGVVVIVGEVVTHSLMLDDPIELRRPDGTSLATRVAGIEVNRQNLTGILLPDVLPAQVPLGTEVWHLSPRIATTIRYTPSKEQKSVPSSGCLILLLSVPLGICLLWHLR